VLVDGAAGAVVAHAGAGLFVVGLTVAGGRIAEIDVFADAARVGRAAGAVLAEGA
jgi:RNA polymerase sigma-70 factor (ECF subfamily)